MNCPKCGAGSRVVVSRPVVSLEGGRCRYRHCNGCRHRWYSWQAPEAVLPDGAVSWSASDVLISANVLRRLREQRP